MLQYCTVRYGRRLQLYGYELRVARCLSGIRLSHHSTSFDRICVCELTHEDFVIRFLPKRNVHFFTATAHMREYRDSVFRTLIERRAKNKSAECSFVVPCHRRGRRLSDT